MLFELHYKPGYSFETMRNRVKCVKCATRAYIRFMIKYMENNYKLEPPERIIGRSDIDKNTKDAQ